MTEETCDCVRISAMAVRDGEAPPLSPEEVEAHLESCTGCRQELEMQEEVVGLLAASRRHPFREDLWPGIEVRIRREHRPVFVPFLLLLAGYKVWEIVMALDLGPAWKILPLALGAALFGCLKENPFAIRERPVVPGGVR